MGSHAFYAPIYTSWVVQAFVDWGQGKCVNTQNRPIKPDGLSEITLDIVVTLLTTTPEAKVQKNNVGA